MGIRIKRYTYKSEPQTSAGCIVFRKLPDTEIEIVLLYRAEPFNEWIFPKGGVETGERIEETAIREVREETGLEEFEIITDLPVIKFTYFADQQQIKFYKSVHYFLAKYKSGNINLYKNPDPGDTKEHVKISWIPVSEAINKVKYLQEKALLRKVQEIIKNSQ